MNAATGPDSTASHHADLLTNFACYDCNLIIDCRRRYGIHDHHRHR